MKANIVWLQSLVEADSYCTLSLDGDGVPLAPHCTRLILRAPHPMYPKTLEHREDHAAMAGLLEDVSNKINSYERLKQMEGALLHTLEWLRSIDLETPENEYEKNELILRLSALLNVENEHPAPKP